MTREEAHTHLDNSGYCLNNFINLHVFIDDIFDDFQDNITEKALVVQSTEVKDIVENLNQVCKTNYKHTSAKTKTLIKARLKDGFTLDDFKKVHITKYAEWYGTDMQKYLRPETLYGTKFESYLNQAPTDYEKLNAITSHTGLTPLQFLKQQGFAE